MTQGPRACPDRDPLFQTESSDLIDRSRALGHQTRSHPVQCLQIELILALLGYAIQVWPKGRFRNGFGVVVVVLLALVEGLGKFGRNDARLKAQSAQRVADKMCTHASL